MLSLRYLSVAGHASLLGPVQAGAGGAVDFPRGVPFGHVDPVYLHFLPEAPLVVAKRTSENPSTLKLREQIMGRQGYVCVDLIEFIPEVRLPAGERRLLHALPVHPSAEAARRVQLAVGGGVVADGLQADGALPPGAGRLGRRHRLLGRPVREAEGGELAVVLLQAAVGLAAGEVVALLALRAGAAHRRALPLAVDALEASAALHLK